MTDSGEKSWWRRTRLHALTMVVGGAAVCILSMVLAPALDGSSLLGIPLGRLAAILVAPAIVLILIFRSAARQRQIDQTFGYFEN